MKIVINKCYGGFSISLDAAKYMAERGHKLAQAEIAKYEKRDAWIKTFIRTDKWPLDCPESSRSYLAIDAEYHKGATFHGYGHVEGFPDSYERNDPLLVAAVEKLKEKANGSHAALEVVEIPDGVAWDIEEYDGREWVAEAHRTWR